MKKTNLPIEATSLPTCPVEERCGACQLLRRPYNEQLAAKQRLVVDLFADIAPESAVMHPISGMDSPYFYRNKVMSPFAPGKKIKQSGREDANKSGRARKPQDKKTPRHEILCGMYEAGTHSLIPTDSCLIENETAKRIILAIRDLMPAHRIEPYREETGTGFLRHVVVRVGHASDEVLVTLVTNDRQFPGSKHFVRDLVKRCPKITSVVQNINTRQTNVILGTEEFRLFGPGFILDTLCGLSLRISSQSFYQVNVAQTEIMYRRAIEMARFTGAETVIDAYCGTGTIGLVAARGIEGSGHAARVIGVDDTDAAIRDARNNARHNNIESADFIAEDAGEFMREYAGETGAVDVVLMDPPRAGASEDFLAALASLAPDRVVYISCNPETQVRDCSYLSRHGYEIVEIQPVDMFPHTYHVENIVMMQRVG